MPSPSRTQASADESETAVYQVQTEVHQNRDPRIGPRQRLPVFRPHIVEFAPGLGQVVQRLHQLSAKRLRVADAHQSIDAGHWLHARQLRWSEPLEQRDGLSESPLGSQAFGHPAAGLKVLIGPVERCSEIAGCRIALLRARRGEPLGLDQRVAESDAQAKLGVRARLDGLHAGEQRDRRLVVRRRLARGRSCHRMIARQLPIAQRGRRVATFLMVSSEQLGLCRRGVAVRLFEGHSDLSMPQHALALEHAVVGRVAHQRVLEAVGRVGRRAAAEHEFGANQVVQCSVELGSGGIALNTSAMSRYPNSRPMTAPTCATSLTGARRSRRAIKRVLQRGGNRQRRQRAAQLVAWSARGASSSKPDCSTVLVNSSTNSGTPSVLRDNLGQHLGRQRLAAR